MSSEIKNIVDQTNLKHIAIIMDGNRRWAKQRHLPSAAGHKEGVKSLKKAVYACGEFGIENLTVYAFSTENWGRKKDEVDFLMNLLTQTIGNELKELYDNNVRILIIGDIEQLNSNLQMILNDAMDKTASNTGLNLQIAINYGSRDEIVYAVKKIANSVKLDEISVNDITKDLITSNLYTSNIPDPDLLIRTGGEQRISNYLLWQIAYSEIYVTDKLWPEFGKDQLQESIIEFSKRNRRFGKG